MSVVVAENVGFSFPSRDIRKREAVPALSNVSLQIDKGEIFGIVGSDGAGKTTLIRLFCGLLTPSEGSLRVLGFDTVKQRSELIRRIGYLSQRFSLYEDLTVGENIRFFAQIHSTKTSRERIHEILEFIGLARFHKRLAGALSGGMKQKLALGCALIHRPEIVFLDEPTNGVDPPSRRDFWNIIADIATGGVTMVISTPYLDEAERCNTIAFMQNGRLITALSPQQAKKQYASRLIQVVCHPVRLACQVVRDLPEVRSAQPFGDRVHVELSADANERQIREVLEKTVQVTQFREIRPTVEDVFIQLVSQRESI